MTEAIVRFVLNKLADVIAKEAELLGGVEEKVKRVQRELIRIQCCLKDADSKRKGDARVQNWLNELRDVAYRIEDATDTFFLEFEDNRHIDPNFLKKFKQLCLKPMEVPVLHKLGTELGKIQKELEEISKSRVDYGIKPLQDKGKGEAIELPFRRAAYQEVDETEIVGFQADKNNILKLLCCKNTPSRAVITIVGPGGLGKTTLAQMVYKSVKANFEYHVMLSISQQFSLIDLLRKMLSMLKYLEKKDVGYLIGELKSLLKNKRYLIILDDVWGIDLWNQLKHALPDVKNRSRVLITSRFVNVAQSANPKTKPYKLDFLGDKDSLNLLLQKALPDHEPKHENCPPDLFEVAGTLSKKCMGLPLALIVVGGILSTKDQTYSAWERVLRTMDWHSEGQDCMKVLAMSYEDMPYYLKACFLYLASFPEDYEISANRLIELWIAEGFIPHQGKKTMEETAEDYLEELFQRSMVQVSRRHTNGSIKYCRLHDLLHDLAMHEAREENLVSIFSEAQYINSPTGLTRRASFQSCSPQFTEYIGQNTRSLLWFGSQLPKYSEFRLLRVLEIVGDFHDTKIMGIEGLIYLKYLGIRNCCRSTKRPSLVLLDSFGRLKNLQTLVLQGIKMECLLKSLWTIDSLRHVQFGHFSRVNGPESTTDLKNLQTLKWVQALGSWKRELPCLNNLRKLGIENSSNCFWNAITNLLKTLPSLISLGIKGINLPTEIVYPKALPNYQNLQSLYLYGAWSENVTLKASLFPPHLVKLVLIGSLLKQDPMPELGKLNSLMKLRLRRVLYSGSRMICPAGFPALQYLEVTECQILLKVANGVMPKLKYFKTPFWGCTLEMSPDQLQHVMREYGPFERKGTGE